MSLNDYLKGKTYKKDLENLNIQYKSLDEDYSTLNQKYMDLSSEYDNLKNKQFSVEKMSLLEIDSENKKIEKEITISNNKLNELHLSIQSETENLNSLILKIKNLQKESLLYDGIEEMEFIGAYIPKYNFMSSKEYKEKYISIREEQKSLVKNENAFWYSRNYTFNNSTSKGVAMLRKNCKLLLRAFNTECEAAINKVKFNNIESIKKRIEKSFEMINKSIYGDLCGLTQEYLNLKINEMYISYEYELKKQEEKEILRNEREKEREEKILQKEVESKKKIIDKEISHFSKALSELESKYETVDAINKDEIQNEINKIKSKLSTCEEELKELDYRIAHASAGYVYIISNIGAFGKNIFKIGVTRRLEPLDRISELSSASVPFKFDIHALIFSYDAYSLESELHKLFDTKRVNKVNKRKEFFYATIDDITSALENYKNLTFEFIVEPDAEEYRQSITKNKENIYEV